MSKMITKIINEVIALIIRTSTFLKISQHLEHLPYIFTHEIHLNFHDITSIFGDTFKGGKYSEKTSCADAAESFNGEVKTSDGGGSAGGQTGDETAHLPLK